MRSYMISLRWRFVERRDTLVDALLSSRCEYASTFLPASSSESRERVTYRSNLDRHGGLVARRGLALFKSGKRIWMTWMCTLSYGRLTVIIESTTHSNRCRCIWGTSVLCMSFGLISRRGWSASSGTPGQNLGPP